MKFKSWDGDIISVVIFGIKQNYLPKAVKCMKRLKDYKQVSFPRERKVALTFHKLPGALRGRFHHKRSRSMFAGSKVTRQRLSMLNARAARLQGLKVKWQHSCL